MTALMVTALLALMGRAETQFAQPAPYVSQPSRALTHLPQAGRDRPVNHVGKAKSMTARSTYQAWTGGRRYNRAVATRAAGLRPHFRNRFNQQERLLNEWAIRVIDGDTFAYGAERIRIRGIDTPELSEPGEFEASQRLNLLLREGTVLIIPKAIDKYQRPMVDVYVDHRNVAAIMTGEGYATTP